LPSTRLPPRRSTFRQWRNPPAESLGNLPFEARVAKHPSAVRRGTQRIDEIRIGRRTK
jgi:hypothetical protein